jgi:hypothetical protein
VVIDRRCSPSGIVGATVCGAVTRADQQALVNLVSTAIARFGEVSVLIRVEPYIGPHHERRFDPDGVWDGRDTTGIVGVAIVGQRAWTTIPARRCRYRRVPVAYFNSEQAARRWLRKQACGAVVRQVSDAPAGTTRFFRVSP